MRKYALVKVTENGETTHWIYEGAIKLHQYHAMKYGSGRYRLEVPINDLTLSIEDENSEIAESPTKAYSSIMTYLNVVYSVNREYIDGLCCDPNLEDFKIIVNET